ncbi:hypothetical protein VN12_08490 [Pirellula sp. SH-Sr6A]|uniref:hypothetical protein n=1 Tax=Pirellula sp. SH-Sr6A TaxID=1632865 RepID=UPI00078E9AC7|nr:hypothetical protein [Pirellula sp. SH-Sr6A]AMV32147.1 hypothetical protein VN12_08490 [Pirellula sp. SH-Sr6A]
MASQTDIDRQLTFNPFMPESSQMLKLMDPIIIAWALTSIFSVYSACKLCTTFLPYENKSVRALCSSIICMALVVFASTINGVLGNLSASRVIFFVLLCSLALFAIAKLRSISLPKECSEKSPSVIRDERTILNGNRLPLWALFIFGTSIFLMNGMFALPLDWDTLMYHLPLTVHWQQIDSLYAPNCARWADPGNNELLALWFTNPFDCDFLFSTANFCGAFLLAVAIFTLGSIMDLSSTVRNALLLFSVTNYTVIRQMVDLKNDLTVCALFLAGLALSLLYLARPQSFLHIIFCVAVGLLAGVKYYAIGYSTLLIIIFYGSLWRINRSFPSYLLIQCILISTPLFMYWYCRNIYISGTPFYPLGLTHDTDQLLRHRSVGLWTTTLLGNGSPYLHEFVLRGFVKNLGWIFTGLCLTTPAVIMVLTIVSYTSQRSEKQKHCIIIIASLFSWLLAVVTPFGAETTPGTLNMAASGYSPIRFSLCGISLSVILAFVLLNRVLRTWNISQESIWCKLMFVTIIAYQAFVLIDAKAIDRVGDVISLSCVTLAALCLIYRLVIRLPKYSVLVLLGLGLVLIAQSRHYWVQNYNRHYDDWSSGSLFTTLDKMEDKPIAILAYVYRYYPLLGPFRERKVIRPERVEDLDSMLKQIIRSSVSFVAVEQVPTGPHYAKAGSILMENPQLFEPVPVSGEIRLFRVKMRSSE